MTDSPCGNNIQTENSSQNNSSFVNGSVVAYITGLLFLIFVTRSFLNRFVVSTYMINVTIGMLGTILIAALLVSMWESSPEETHVEIYNAIDSSSHSEWIPLCKVEQLIDADLIHAKLISEGIPTTVGRQEVSGYGMLDTIQQTIKIHPNYVEEAQMVLRDSPFSDYIGLEEKSKNKHDGIEIEEN